jgi:DNA helicase-2/ATP-dependent DNA helicase PcrA
MLDDEILVIPTLEGDAAKAISHRGGHVQIIASAGSGKTEVVSQRVASLIADGEDPASIVAFTFTEKAAAELKERIRLRVTAAVGEHATDQLGRLYVGTIHGYCFQLLQTHVPTYETWTPLDENQLVNLLYREQSHLGLKQLNGSLFKSIDAFRRSIDVVENELLRVEDLPPGSFRDTATRFYAMLENYRFMSFGTQIVLAVKALEDPAIHARVTQNLRHLIVDEYQDVNPAQERLVELLANPLGCADLTVVGDDDQAIYQWRGSNVDNIVTFDQRYVDVTKFELLVNRRSRPAIVELANGFAQSIPGRLDKEMRPHREANGTSVAIAVSHEDEVEEADVVAMGIEKIHASGVPYRDIAILVRSRTAYGKLVDALEMCKIPVQPGGRTGLFAQPEANAFGATYAWCSGVDWAPARFQKRESILIDGLLDLYQETFGLTPAQRSALQGHLIAWKQKANASDFNESLVGDFYDLLALLGVSSWDNTSQMTRNRLGTIARFTAVLADYESVTQRARRDAANAGEQVGGRSGGEWYYRNFAYLLSNYAVGGYDDFDGEDDVALDAVALGTVHGAKGLEWPVVFLPSLTAKRFPSSRTGSPQDWLLPTALFDAARYEGTDADERRLFYVALTRARDWVRLSSHSKTNVQTAKPSPYLTEAVKLASSGGAFPTGALPKGIEAPDLAVTYSELAAYTTCPQSFLLRNELGFMPPIQSELGYGNAVHHVMRSIAEHCQSVGRMPTPREINDLLTTEFFLPYANKPAHKEMRERARKLVFKYVADYRSDLERTWATERPFELYLPGVVISGRADVIYDLHYGQPDHLAIVDYKTSTGGAIEPLQLQVYVQAGRREGLTVDAAYVHDMGTTKRHDVPVTDLDIAAAEAHVLTTAESLKARDFTPAPEVSKCRSCDVRKVCGAAKLK